jgi:hypothetical protein
MLFLYFLKDCTNKGIYFSVTYYHTAFQNPLLFVASIAPASQVPVSAMLSLLANKIKMCKVVGL